VGGDIITGVRQLIQDLVSPDLKAIKEKQEALARELELMRQSTAAQFEAQRQYTTAQLDALMKNIEAFRAEFRAEMTLLRTSHQLEVLRQITPLAERVAALESQQR
jgi:hypothetical protein